MDFYTFLKSLENKGMLKAGFECGVIPPHYRKHYEIKKDFDRMIGQRPNDERTVIMELCIKHGISWNWCYKIVK